MCPFDVGVVGGGAAGWAAALELARAGRRVVLLEARPQVGGRAGVFTGPEGGGELPAGEHLLFGCCREVRRLCEEVGAASALQVERRWRLPFYGPGGRRGELRVRALPAPWHLVGAVLGARHLSLPGRLAVVRLCQGLRRRPPREGETAAAWWARTGQPAHAVAGFWEPLCLAFMNAPPAEASARLFAAAVGELLRGGREGSARIRFRRPLGAILAAGEAQLRARGGEVRLRAPVRRLRFVDGRARAAELAGGAVVTARAFVLAVPRPALERLLPATGWLPPPPATRGILAAHLWFDAPVRLPGMVGLLSTLPQWLFDAPAGEGRYRQAVVGAADRWFGLEDGALTERVLRDLRAALPALRATRLRAARLLRLRGATPLLGPATRLLPTTTPWPNVFLAGDLVDTGLPATLEGAARSGVRAAAAAAREL